MPLKIVWTQEQAELPPIADWPALSFSGGTTQIRRTLETTGVNPLEKSCGRQSHESESIVVAAGFSCPVAKNVPSDALKRDSPEALPTEWKPKLPRAIPANCNFESRVRAAPRGAWCQLDGKSHFLSQKHRLARNSEPRKTAHTPAPLQGPQSPADSTSAAPISRFEFASPLASFDYATPAVSLRQPHRVRRAQKSQILHSP